MDSQINPLLIKYSNPEGIFFIDREKLSNREGKYTPAELHNKDYTWASNSLGRDQPEQRYDRDCFTHDRDKIIYLDAFKRLKNKSQVIINPLGQDISTRLTHTHEVTHFARSLCTNLGYNSILAEAIGLGHDLGHPPYGHVGESSLQNIMRKLLNNKDFKFHHAKYGLEIVNRIEPINLTYEVKDGILKHTTGSVRLDKQTDLPKTPEGMFVRLADKAAYTTGDIWDCINVGILKESDLPQAALKVLGKTHSAQVSKIIEGIMLSSLINQKISFDGEVFEAFEEIRRYMYDNVYDVKEELINQRIPAKRVVNQVFDIVMHEEFGNLDQKEAAFKTLDRVACMTDVSIMNYLTQYFSIPRL